MKKDSLCKFAKELYNEDNSGHDWSHVKRVLKHCKKIQYIEGGDKEIIFTSALLHDLHRLMANKQGKYVEPKDSIPIVSQILKDFSFQQDKINAICFIIENHEKKERKFENLELNILKDSDILDSFGKIGLRRTLKYCKKHNIPITSTTFSLDCKEYIPDINPISATHYIYRTIIQNQNNLTTQTAKKLAKNKIQLLESFVKRNYK